MAARDTTVGSTPSRSALESDPLLIPSGAAVRRNAVLLPREHQQRVRDGRRAETRGQPPVPARGECRGRAPQPREPERHPDRGREHDPRAGGHERAPDDRSRRRRADPEEHARGRGAAPGGARVAERRQRGEFQDETQGEVGGSHAFRAARGRGTQARPCLSPAGRPATGAPPQR
jgi:hypothetical protein